MAARTAGDVQLRKGDEMRRCDLCKISGYPQFVGPLVGPIGPSPAAASASERLFHVHIHCLAFSEPILHHLWDKDIKLLMTKISHTLASAHTQACGLCNGMGATVLCTACQHFFHMPCAARAEFVCRRGVTCNQCSDSRKRKGNWRASAERENKEKPFTLDESDYPSALAAMIEKLKREIEDKGKSSNLVENFGHSSVFDCIGLQYPATLRIDDQDPPASPGTGEAVERVLARVPSLPGGAHRYLVKMKRDSYKDVKIVECNKSKASRELRQALEIYERAHKLPQKAPPPFCPDILPRDEQMDFRQLLGKYRDEPSFYLELLDERKGVAKPAPALLMAQLAQPRIDKYEIDENQGFSDCVPATLILADSTHCARYARKLNEEQPPLNIVDFGEYHDVIFFHELFSHDSEAPQPKFDVLLVSPQTINKLDARNYNPFFSTRWRLLLVQPCEKDAECLRLLKSHHQGSIPAFRHAIIGSQNIPSRHHRMLKEVLDMSDVESAL
eukprot:m.286161 g.286161  ORF g.286161 m.286161 type:complete len:501 (-) comp11527_c0_seq1:2314-3816(-)